MQVLDVRFIKGNPRIVIKRWGGVPSAFRQSNYRNDESNKQTWVKTKEKAKHGNTGNA